MSTTSFVTLPFLALISIPLALTACITICFSVVALFLQASLISIELCYALFINIFTIPHSSSWSLLSFTASAPATPRRRQSTDQGLNKPPSSLSYHPHHHHYHHSHHLPTNPALWGPLPTRPSLGPRYPSQPLQDNTTTNNNISPIYTGPDASRRPSLPQTSPSLLFQGLISGDSDRDFEGLGGWRCPPSSSKSRGHRSGHTSPSSTHSVSDEVDDHAWISINSRLELPSRPLIRRNSSDKPDLYLLPSRRGGTQQQQQQQAQPHTYHRRAFTTSTLSGLGTRSTSSPSLSAVNKREIQNGLPPPKAHPQGQSGGTTGEVSHLHNSYYLHWDRHLVSGSGAGSGPLSGPQTTDHLHSHNHLPDGSYFAIQTQSKSGARTTSNSSPNEEGNSAKLAAATAGGSWITHSPSGVRDQRRRSMSRSSSVRVALPDRLLGEEGWDSPA